MNCCNIIVFGNFSKKFFFSCSPTFQPFPLSNSFSSTIQNNPTNICSSSETASERKGERCVHISLNARWSTKRNCSFFAVYPIPLHHDAVAAFLRSHVPSFVLQRFYRSINIEAEEEPWQSKRSTVFTAKWNDLRHVWWLDEPFSIGFLLDLWKCVRQSVLVLLHYGTNKILHTIIVHNSSVTVAWLQHRKSVEW